MEWKSPNCAPMDGETVIFAEFTAYPHPTAAIWNDVEYKWAVAEPQWASGSHDTYFQTELYDHKELQRWASSPANTH